MCERQSNRTQPAHAVSDKPDRFSDDQRVYGLFRAGEHFRQAHVRTAPGPESARRVESEDAPAQFAQNGCQRPFGYGGTAKSMKIWHEQ
jgi:hypothetical protein